MHCCRPAGAGVQQLLARVLGEVTDCALGNSILKMSVHARKGELLVARLACLFESVVRKLSIITVIMLNSHTVLTCKLFERALGLDGLFRGQV